MKKLLFATLTMGLFALTSCIQPAQPTQPAGDPAAQTPPARSSATYDEPPVEPAVKGPAAEPAKKKGHSK